MKLSQKLNLVIGLSLLTASASQAALTLADGVTDAVEGGSLFTVTNLNATTDMGLGGDGLTSDDIFTANAKGGNSWVTNRNSANWFNTHTADPVLTFTFDLAQTRIQGMTIWSYPSTGPGNGVSAGTVEFFDGATSLGTEALTIAIGYDVVAKTYQPGTVNAFGTNYDSVTSAVVTFTANYVAGNVGGDRVGAGTVAFDVVPEPSSAALLGLGGLALILRRRK